MTEATQETVRKGWLTYKDIELYCGVSRWSILHAIQDGELECSKLGRKVLVKRSDLDAWLESRRSRA